MGGTGGGTAPPTTTPPFLTVEVSICLAADAAPETTPTPDEDRALGDVLRAAKPLSLPPAEET